MNFCNQCGHELGIGRFCTNCGHPVGQPLDQPASPAADTLDHPVGDTAERPAVTPVTPPPAPTGSRFPLFADEVDEAPGPYDAPYSQPRTTTTPLPPPLPPPAPTRASRHGRRRGAVLPWVLGALVLVLLGLVATLLVVRGHDGQPTTATPPSRHRSPAPGTPTSGPPTSGRPTDLARYLQVEAPRAAAPNQDVHGNLVRYVATNMLDGVAETCWRTPGDASGETIRFTLPQSTVVSEVGLVNGYAKVASGSTGTYDWYRGNRRITAVEWTFDDGTTVRQHLDQTTAMQTVPVDDVVTGSVSLRLLSVTPPGKGRAARDYTAISDVDVTGAAAG